MTDHDLASLGDAYTNFIYSLLLSNQQRKPAGKKVKGEILAQAIKKAGLRNHLPAKMTRHTIADAAEALIVYAWLTDHITIAESVNTLAKVQDPVEGFCSLLSATTARIKLS
jgi:uncharacterized protein YfaQ (DUF2300 family)